MVSFSRFHSFHDGLANFASASAQSSCHFHDSLAVSHVTSSATQSFCQAHPEIGKRTMQRGLSTLQLETLQHVNLPSSSLKRQKDLYSLTTYSPSKLTMQMARGLTSSSLSALCKCKLQSAHVSNKRTELKRFQTCIETRNWQEARIMWNCQAHHETDIRTWVEKRLVIDNIVWK